MTSIAAVHESDCGPSQTRRDVRYKLAIGSKADLTQTLGFVSDWTQQRHGRPAQRPVPELTPDDF
jgi:hypothetical protein